MTRQEAFNTAYFGVIAQGCASIANEHCLYRGPNGTKCGIGHLLTDEEAKSLDVDTRNNSVDFLLMHGRLPARFSPADKDFYSGLQSAHDRASVGNPSGSLFVLNFQSRMGRLAKAYGLSVPA